MESFLQTAVQALPRAWKVISQNHIEIPRVFLLFFAAKFYEQWGRKAFTGTNLSVTAQRENQDIWWRETGPLATIATLNVQIGSTTANLSRGDVVRRHHGVYAIVLRRKQGWPSDSPSTRGRETPLQGNTWSEFCTVKWAFTTSFRVLFVVLSSSSNYTRVPTRIGTAVTAVGIYRCRAVFFVPFVEQLNIPFPIGRDFYRESAVWLCAPHLQISIIASHVWPNQFTSSRVISTTADVYHIRLSKQQALPE